MVKMQEIQEPILRQAHYENVPLYSLDELEALSERELQEARKERIEAEQRLAEAVKFRQEAQKLGQEIDNFINSMTAKYGNKD
ncbi:MAG: hypothetical protein K2I71_08135 [Helicobacter sp.]|nr:hypothetical protein [Helicobacter sp.]